MPGPDVVIIGGGAVGCATAYFLSRQGARPLVVERDAIGSHASGFAFGGLSPYSGHGIPGPLYPLARRSWEMHLGLAEALPRETGVDPGFTRTPAYPLATTEGEARHLQGTLKWLRSEGFTARWLDGDEVRRREPRLALSVLGALEVEETGLVESYRFCLALAQAAEAHGARFHHGRAVSLEVQGGRLRGVRLERGAIPCDRLVLAAGPWTGLLAPPDSAIPVGPLKGQIVRLRLRGGPLRCYIAWRGNYAATKPDGLVWAGTTEEQAGFDEVTTPGARDAILTALAQVFPPFLDADIVLQTACLRPLSADGLPVIGTLPGVEGAFVATGGGRKGILLAPVMGWLSAQWALTGTTDMDLTPFSPARFLTAGAGPPATWEPGPPLVD